MTAASDYPPLASPFPWTVEVAAITLGEKKCHEYEMCVTTRSSSDQTGSSWLVCRRYREFDALRRALQSDRSIDHDGLPPFPRKAPFGRALTPSELEQR